MSMRILTGIAGMPSGFPNPNSSHVLRHPGGTKCECTSILPGMPILLVKDGVRSSQRLKVGGRVRFEVDRGFNAFIKESKWGDQRFGSGVRYCVDWFKRPKTPLHPIHKINLCSRLR